MLSLLLSLHTCQLARIGSSLLVVQRNVNKIIIFSVLLLLLVDLNWACPIEEVVSLLALQEQRIEVLMLFD